MRTDHHRPGLWPGLLLVSIGAGLLARELGLLPAHVSVWDFWPLLVIVIGVTALLRASGIVSVLLALTFSAIGGVLLAAKLGFLPASSIRLWPVLLVLLGLTALFRRGRGPDSPRDDSTFGEPELDQTTDADRLSRQYTCSGASLRIESQAWKGGELGVTAGGVELDLRHARLDDAGAVLVLRVMMGGVDIRVPDTWHVQLDVTPLLGGADDSTRSTQGSGASPRLRIVGKVTLGGVNVQN